MAIKLRINFKDLYNNQEITSHTMDREVVKKEESDYGIYYTLKCGWYVDYNYQYKRWEITTLKKGDYVGRFSKEDIKEINN
tara:strand:+ start:436 stop:678 length:243 start_codon:yes stop_codon:yes gene_type:complete